jgi:hypothetical protein
MSRSLSIASLIFVVSSAASARAQTVSWGSSVNFDWGYQPVAATNGWGAGFEVEQHLGGVPGTLSMVDIWDNTGTWSQSLGRASDNFDTGAWQSVAGDSSSSNMLFVSAYTLWNADQMYLYTRTGTLSTNGTLSWVGTNWENNPGQGFYPSIAQANIPGQPTQFIMFYNKTDCSQLPCSPNDGVLAYMTGVLNGDGTTISWGSEHTWSAGWYPSVAIAPIVNSSNQFFVVEAHQGTGDNGTSLWMDFGVLTAGSDSINFAPETQNYDWGASPSVAICAEGGRTPSVIEVHNGGGGSTAGWYHAGRIQGCFNSQYPWCTAALGNSQQFDIGQAVIKPTVACTNNWGYEVHQDGVGGSGLHETRFSIN